MIINFEKNITKIYEEFKGYSIGSNINFSQEYADDIKYRLINSPLKTLSAEDIMDYLSSPKFEIYDESEIKYFLPRIIELFIVGKKISIVDQDVFKIFDNVNNWSFSECNILSQFSSDYFEFEIFCHSGVNVLELFYIFRANVFKSENFFKIWINDNSLQSLISFSNMLSVNKYFQYKHDEVSLKIIIWIKNEKTKKHFENLIFTKYIDNINNIDGELANQIDYLTIFLEEG